MTETKNGCVICDHCGHFTSWKTVETYVLFGTAADTEPPDDSHICPSCRDKEMATRIAEKVGPPSHWIKAPWEYVVAKQNGYVLVAPRGAAWSVWHRSDTPLQDGWEIRQ